MGFMLMLSGLKTKEQKMSISDQIQIICVENQQVLFTCSIEEIEKAYQFLKELDDYGVEAIIKIPNTIETLALALGQENSTLIEEELNLEVSQHDSCCHTPSN